MIGIREGVPLGEQSVDDVLRHVLRLPFGRVRVHPEPGCRVHLDDRAAGLADGLRDVGREEVDPGHVEADDPGRLLGDLDVVLVRLPGAVDRDAARRHVAGLGEQHRRTFRRDVLEAVPLLLHQRDRGLVDGDPRQHLLVTDAAARVLVRLLHELGHRPPAVADHVGRLAFGDRDHVPADHEHPVVVAGHVGLHDHLAAARLLLRPAEPAAHRLLGPQVEPDAAPVVAVERFGDHREPDPLRGRHGGVGVRARPRSAAPGGPPPRAAGSSSSCRPRCRRRARSSSRSSWRGSAAGTCPGRAGRASTRSAASTGCRGSSPRRGSPGSRARTAAARPAGSAARARRRSRRPGRPSRGGSTAGRRARPPRPRRAPRRSRRSRCTGLARRPTGSSRARCARPTPAGARAPRARRRARARCRPRGARGTRPGCPSEHECSPTPGSSFRSFALKPGIVFEGQCSSEPRSTSSRMQGS